MNQNPKESGPPKRREFSEWKRLFSEVIFAAVSQVISSSRAARWLFCQPKRRNLAVFEPLWLEEFFLAVWLFFGCFWPSGKKSIFSLNKDKKLLFFLSLLKNFRPPAKKNLYLDSTYNIFDLPNWPKKQYVFYNSRK